MVMVVVIVIVMVVRHAGVGLFFFLFCRLIQSCVSVGGVGWPLFFLLRPSSLIQLCIRLILLSSRSVL